MKNGKRPHSIDNPSPKPYALKSIIFILLAMVLFCILLFLIGFPMWTILIFGIGMVLTLLALYLIASMQMELNAKDKLLEDSIKQDLYP